MRTLTVVLTRFLCLCAVLLALPTNVAAQTFNVDSTQGWQTTSLNVTAGQQLSFSASGSWSVDHRNFSFVGPEGYSAEEDGRILPGMQAGSATPIRRIASQDRWRTIVFGNRQRSHVLGRPVMGHWRFASTMATPAWVTTRVRCKSRSRLLHLLRHRHLLRRHHRHLLRRHRSASPSLRSRASGRGTELALIRIPSHLVKLSSSRLS